MERKKCISLDCFKELFGFSDKAIENIRLNSKYGKSSMDMYRDIDSERMVKHFVEFDFKNDRVLIIIKKGENHE